jgi:hypothetical protein
VLFFQPPAIILFRFTGIQNYILAYLIFHFLSILNMNTEKNSTSFILLRLNRTKVFAHSKALRLPGAKMPSYRTYTFCPVPNIFVKHHKCNAFINKPLQPGILIVLIPLGHRSTVNCQPSTVNRQLPTVNRQPKKDAENLSHHRLPELLPE